MELSFYAQPYDVSAEGFYFRTMEEYEAQIGTIKNSFGQQVEEFEIQFIDGGTLDSELARAWGLSQASVASFIEAAEKWDEEDKIRFILAVGECGYFFDPENVDPSDFDVDIYRSDSMRDLAIEFVAEGLFGEVPSHLEAYVDYDAIARDLAIDYSEAIIAGERLIYRCA
ncbi:antirestriction protein ArdA [Roseibium album]|uniref:antirestriction protein ArdA n=1 Tax=Roseibium album TaxID=311410 RepID=UPI003298DD29